MTFDREAYILDLEQLIIKHDLHGMAFIITTADWHQVMVLAKCQSCNATLEAR